jgi:hypothetical protein
MRRRKTAARQPHHQPKKRDQSAPDNDQPSVRDLEHANLLVQRRMLLVTGIIGFVTACYVTITLLQYFALREQIADARRSGDQALRETRNAQRLDQRAWIGITKVEILKNRPDPALMSITLSNSGKTPALAVKVDFHVLTLPAGNEDIIQSHIEEEPKRRFGGTNDSIHPSATNIVDGWLYDQNGRRTSLTAQQLAAIADGTLTIYGHGRVEYQDVFGRAHWLTFCERWDRELRDYVACGRGNASDDVPKAATEPEPLRMMDIATQKPFVPRVETPAPPRESQPTLASASLLVMADHGYPDPAVKITATLFSSSGTVIGDASPSDMTFAKNGDVTLMFTLRSTARKYDAIYLRLITTPPPKEMLGSINWTFRWADGTMRSSSVNQSNLPDKDGVWSLWHVNPANFSINPFPRD